MKAEYFDAFQNAKKQLVEKGFHLAFLENTSRWCIDEDLYRRARFQEFVKEKYELSDNCSMLGMSAGGLISVKYAALYPENVAVLYLDAPVMNLLSCPMGLGIGWDGSEELYEQAGLTLIELLNYRDHPTEKNSGVPKRHTA